MVILQEPKMTNSREQLFELSGSSDAYNFY